MLPMRRSKRGAPDDTAQAESDIGDVPSKRSRPSGSRVSNDENETPPDAEHGAARKQRRTQRGRTATPPLRSAPRRARAASPSDSGTSQESDEDTGYELTRQQEQRAQQQQQTQAHAGGGEEAEEGLGIQRCGSPDNEVRSEEDPASDADDFVPEEVLAEEFELRSQGLPGQLDCMRLENFMCHENFFLRFGPHVTFINGTNGSGKSAILQGMQFCLGMQAAKTGRAGTAKHLIRNGANGAKVAVTLWNTGEEAFRPQVYGDRVTIERRITGSGASKYRVLNPQGRVVSEKRDDMQVAADAMAVLDYFNLDVSKPVTVMTQEMCKDFLAGSSNRDAAARQRYKLYMKATSLEQAEEGLARARDNVHEVYERLQTEVVKFQAIKAEEKEIAKRLEELTACEAERAEAELLERAVVWSRVEDAQREEEAVSARIAAAQAAKAQAEARRQAKQAEVDACDEANRSEMEVLDRFTADLERLTGEQRELSKASNQAKKAAGKADAAVAKLHKRIADLEEQKQTLEVASGEADAETAAASKAAQAAQEEEVEACRAGREQLAKEVDDLRAVHEEAKQAFKVAVDIERDARGRFSEVQSQMTTLQNANNRARAAKGDRVAAFGQSAAQLHRLIQQNANRFHRLPIGPVGSVLALKEASWATAVDAQIGKMLDNFLVHDRHDLQALQQLARSIRWQDVTIVVASFDTPLHRVPHSNVKTVMDVVACTDAQIRTPVSNFLIDHGKAERTALCDNDDDAQRASRLSHVQQALMPDGSKWYTRGRASTHIPYRGNPWNRGRLGSDDGQQEAQLMAEMQHCQAELQRLYGEAEAAKAALVPAQQRMVTAHRALMARQKEKVAADTQVDELISQLSHLTQPEATGSDGQADGDSQTENLIAQAAADIFQLREDLRPAEEKARIAHDEADAATQSAAAKREESERLQAENAQRTDAMQTRLDALQELKDEVETAERFITDMNQRISREEAAHAEAAKELEAGANSRGMAEEACTEEEGRAALEQVRAKERGRGGGGEEQAAKRCSTKGMSDRLKKIKTKLAASERQAGGSATDLKAELTKARKSRLELQHRMQNVVSAFNKAAQGVEDRKRRMKERRKWASGQVKRSFGQTLWRRRQLGTIKIVDHVETEDGVRPGVLHITLQAESQQSQPAAAVTELKSLSGGERSYINVAFTLAVGEVASSPFRIMDEFDVFMDANNRQMTMAALFSFAYLNQDMQMVLISPQDLRGVEEAKLMLANDLRDPMVLPDGFIRVVRVLPARDNAIQGH